MGQTYTVALEAAPRPEDVAAINQGLLAYNLQHAPDDHYQPLVVFLRATDGALAGGLLGETYWGWLHISVLWLAEPARGQRFGSQMLQLAEQEAQRRDCRHVHLDTLSFQA